MCECVCVRVCAGVCVCLGRGADLVAGVRTVNKRGMCPYTLTQNAPSWDDVLQPRVA